MEAATRVEPALPPIIQRVWLDERKIRRAVRRIARQIDRDYAGLMPHLVTIMKGGLFFLTDLARALTIPHTLDFLAITSYNTTSTSGEVRITKDLDEPIAGRHVIIVEDILDTGLTLAYIYKNLERRRPASLKVCVFLDRPYRRLIDIPIAYKGFDAPDEFLVGYGLDWRQQYRSLPYIGIVKPEVLRAEAQG
ncbi:MAG: hypoxanthine phosphoribosyltransferase [Armatimonadota bacterium]|nr:hypoxanthine phosphoribosyltransferase [Armatimonadota bacterium]